MKIVAPLSKQTKLGKFVLEKLSVIDDLISLQCNSVLELDQNKFTNSWVVVNACFEKFRYLKIILYLQKGQSIDEVELLNFMTVIPLKKNYKWNELDLQCKVFQNIEKCNFNI